MTKRIQAKHKISRRLGVNLWGSAKYNNEKNYPPGQHGPLNIAKRRTDYGLHLVAKQKLKGYYANIKERQFRKLYLEAKKIKGDTGQNLVSLLESRLDAVIYRANFVPTMHAARQFINHKHIEVNGKTVNISSYRLKIGDVVTIKKSSQELLILLETIQKKEREVPEYIQVDYKTKEVKILNLPNLADIPYPVVMEPNLVVEYYSA
jgi:small subunit ribosomal protein S4